MPKPTSCVASSICMAVARASHVEIDLARLLSSLRPEHFGMLALGFHVADMPERARLTTRLLFSNFQLVVDETVVHAVFERIILHHRGLIDCAHGMLSPLQPRRAVQGVLSSAIECIPCSVTSACLDCAGALCRRLQYPTKCYTLSLGKRPGSVFFSECMSCGRLFGGVWSWAGPKTCTFPEGHHRPQLAAQRDAFSALRYFFAYPGHAYSVDFLEFVFRLMARGGAQQEL